LLASKDEDDVEWVDLNYLCRRSLKIIRHGIR